MSYTPIGWQTGDTITAEKLNKMDPGWSAAMAQLFSETVTTVAGEFGNEAELAYGEFIEAPSIIVSFNGTDYECERIVGSDPGTYFYGGFSSGAPDFTDYPFFIYSDGYGNTNLVYTETAGTYTVAVSAVSVETSQNFAAAVGKATPNPLFHVIPDETTWQEVYDAVNAGKLAYILETDVYPLVMQFVSWVGESDHGDFVVATINYTGSAVGTAIFSASSEDGVLEWA